MTTGGMAIPIENRGASNGLIDVEVGAAELSTARDQSRPRWLIATSLAVLPVGILVVLRASPYFRLNNGDPFIYVGYSNDFVGHVQRFGYTYHGVRWGLIFPLRASLTLGPVWGYFVLRYLLYLVAIVPMYFALRPAGTKVALLGPVVFVANPVTTCAILSTHPDTMTVPLFTAMFALLAIGSRRKGKSLLAGVAAAAVCAGLGINSNIFFTVFAAITFGAFWLMLVARREMLSALLSGLIFGLVVILLSVLGMLVYRHYFQNADIYSTTLAQMRNLSGDKTFVSPSLEWLSTRRYVYAPLVALALGFSGLVSAKRREGRWSDQHLFIFGVVLLSLGFYVFNQFAMGGNSIETSYYFSYIVGPMSLLTAASLGWLGGGRRIPTGVVLALPIGLAYVTQLLEIKSFVVFASVAMALGLATQIRKIPMVALSAALVFMHISWGSAPRQIRPIPRATFQFEPHYEDAFGDVSTGGFEAYELATQLPTVVPSEPGRSVPALFWYRSGDAMLDSTEASYHWETYTVQRSPGPGMPNLAADDLRRVQTLAGVGNLVLLARTQPELDAGILALRANGVVLGEPLPRRELRAGKSSVVAVAIPVLAVS
jgi:hypothetical protein